MTQETNATGLSETLLELYGIVRRLEAMYPGRHFTPDGHMVGSLGEVYAADRYGLELFEASHAVHDARAKDGRLVQVKATQRKSVAMSSEPDYLIVLLINEDGRFDEVYNGPGAMAWDLVKDKPLPKNGQYQISLSRLEKLNEQVDPKDRI